MIIGLSGKAGSGKDTAADFLVNHHNFFKIGLADPLKRVCLDVFKFSPEQLWGPSERRNEQDLRYPREGGEYLTPRYALQRLGTEWGRDCYKDVWVEYAVRTCNEVLRSKSGYDQRLGSLEEQKISPHSGAVISDVRFKNEVEGLRSRGAKLLRIKGEFRQLSGEAASHSSEVEQDSIPDSDFDFVIVNDGTINELYLKVEAVYRVLQAEQLYKKHAGEFADFLETIRQKSPDSSNLLDELLQKRFNDLRSRRLMEYDPNQADIAPFKRKP